jgi:parallel beta-helix repeat protein
MGFFCVIAHGRCGPVWKRFFFLSVAAILGTACQAGFHIQSAPGPARQESAMKTVHIGPFESREKETHREKIQAALDNGGEGAVFVFAPGEYHLTDPAGLRPPARATLLLEGAHFVLSEKIQADGQAFLLEDVSDISFSGGEITGHREKWDPGVNIAGIRAYGAGSNLRIEELTCRNLSSNAVGVFGRDAAHPFRNVTLTRVIGINCCNFYGDYLSDARGPAPGSRREDQGTAAFYHVDGWLVESCRFEQSQSDGTHFYHSPNGRFVNSVVAESQMGGYFLEGCENVIAMGNLIRGNGSRGVTIERDSRNCILAENIIENSGREGCWMPDVSGIIVANNIFRRNGRKDDTDRDCEIRIDDTDRFKTVTSGIRIEGNLFCTDKHQTAAVFSGQKTPEIDLEANTFQGPAPRNHREDG